VAGPHGVARPSLRMWKVDGIPPSDKFGGHSVRQLPSYTTPR